MEEKKFFNIWKWLVILLVGCNMALIGIIWFKPQNMPPPPPGRKPRIDFNKQLSFTPEQDKLFSKASLENRHKIDSLKTLARDVRDQFFASLKSGNQSADADSLATVLGNYHKLIELQTYHHFTEVRKMLDDKQKIVFDGLIFELLKNLPEQPRMTRGHGQDHADGPPPPDDRRGPPPPDRDEMPPRDNDAPPPPDGH